MISHITGFLSQFMPRSSVPISNALTRNFVKSQLSTILILIVGLIGINFDANASGGGPPTNKAAFLNFTDTDPNVGKIGGTVTIGKATDESKITHYVLRWGLLGHCSAANSFIAEIPKTGSNITWQLPQGTQIPAAVYELLVYTKNANGEMLTCQSQYKTITDYKAPAPDKIAKAVTLTKTATNIVSDLASWNIRVEDIDIKPASSEANITHYAVYWANSWGTKSILYPNAIVTLAKTGGPLTWSFPANATAPWPIWGIVVCSRNYNQEYCGPVGNSNRASYPLMGDLDYAEIINNTLPAMDDIVTGVLGGGNCPGANIVASCGNRTCDTNETAANCPSDCTNYAIASYNFQTICSATQLALTYHPTSIAQIQSIVTNAVATGKHVKAVSGALPLDHNVTIQNLVGTASDFVCTDGVTIGTDQITPANPNFPISIQTFEGKEVVNVPAGMRLIDLGKWLHDRGRGVGYAHMGWADVSIGGNISMSAHGSSPTNRNVLAHRVVGLDVVGPDGVLRSYSEGTTNSDTFKALRTGLGYLGVIVNVKLEIEPDVNLHVKITYHNEDELFDGTPDSFFQSMADCDWGQFNWYPGRNAYVRACGKETTEALEAGAENTLLKPEIPAALNIPMQNMMQAGACDLENGVMEFVETFRYLQLLLTPPMAKDVNGQHVPTGDAIGPQYLMQTSHLLDGQTGFFQLDWEVAVPYTHMQAAAEYVRNFLDGQNVKNRDINLPLVGVFTRFGISEDKTLMAYTGTGGDWIDGEPLVFMEMPIYIPVGFDQAKMADYLAPFIEYTTYLIQNYDARGHWAKNREWMFPLEQAEGNLNHDNRFTRFNAVINQIDPNGVFANAAGKRLGITYSNFTYPAGW